MIRTFLSRLALLAALGFPTITSLATAATTTTTFPVSMVISATCSVQATGMNFGTVTSGGSYDSNGSITVNCVSGTPYAVALDKGTSTIPNARSTSFTHAQGTTQLGYELYKDVGKSQVWGDAGFGATYPTGTPVLGTGSGSPQQLTVYGHANIPSGNFIIPAGTYTDTVTVTVNF